MAKILDESSSEETSSSEEGICSAPIKYGKNNAWVTAGIIIADVVGAGILSMPVAVKQFGWLLGAILLFLLLAANVHVSLLMWRVQVRCESCKHVRTYPQLAEGAFAAAPKWQRCAMTCVSKFSQTSFIFGIMGLYLLSAGKGFGMIFYENRTLCLPQWALFASLLIFPFAAVSRNMGSCECLVWLNIATLCGTVLIPLAYYAFVGTEGLRPPDSNTYAINSISAHGLLSGLSTYTFAFTSQFMLTEIIEEMEDPEELPKAYATISGPFQLSMFLLAGLGGYFAIGDKVSGMMNENLPFGPPFQVAAACMCTHMLISYIIKGVVFCKAMHEAVDPDHCKGDDMSIRAWIGWVALVSITLVVAWILANVVPFFTEAVDLLGASLTPLSCWVLPIFMFIRYWKDANRASKPHISGLEWFVIACELLLALCLMIFGTYSVLCQIIEKWSELGKPFECHCEFLRNNCECSENHAGMEAICRVGANLTAA
mmetsp:Transcript_111666/g.216235  ORF Transcript_111666/g.216235 Transcript_111666/m.216235 type:complete len:485 (-) Transcript_111666:80-1534(-)